MLTIGTTVLGVDDIARALSFWTTALDYVPRDDPPGDDTFVVLVPRTGQGGGLSLMRSETMPRHQPRVHLDLYTPEPAAQVDRLLALGATRVPWTYPADADFVVLADPDGNRFCVIDKSAR